MVGGDLPPLAGTEHYEGVPTLPVGDATIDMVLCLEAYPTLQQDDRRGLLREAYRVLRPGGLFAAWIRHPPQPDDNVDFWTLEEELSTVYERTYMMAQMPWRGFSLAPVLDDEPEASAPTLTLDEGLLGDAPEASHYLAIAFRQRPSAKLVERLTAECLLVPTPQQPSAPPPVQPEQDTGELIALRATVTQARVREETLSRHLESLQSEVTEAEDGLRQAQDDLGATRQQVEQERSRARTLEHDLGQRVQALQLEVEGAREHADALDRGLEQQVVTLREQATRAQARAEAMEAVLADVRSDDLPEQLIALREQAERAKGRAEVLETTLRERTEHAQGLETQLREQAEQGQAKLQELEVRLREQERTKLEGLDVQLREQAERGQVRLQEIDDKLEQRGERVRTLEGALQQRTQQVEALHAAAAEQAEQTEALQQALDEARREDLGAQIVTLRQQLERSEVAHEETESGRLALSEQLRTKATDLTVLTATVRDLEQSLARMSERVEARSRELENQGKALAEQQQRYDGLAEDRDELTHQMEVALAEREGARQLAARVEAELEQARRRLTEQAEALAEKSQQASRMGGELQVLRERLQHQETMLDQTRSRAEELSATAAKGSEQGRMLAEVARDRDQLREELTRRSTEIQRLEERLWETREEIQKERLDAVRSAGELERLREQGDRARDAEQARNRELEQLSAELRELEVERANAQGQLRSRDEEIARMRRDIEAMSTESADVAALREDLQARSRELGELTEQLLQARAREQDAQAQAKRREAQLSEAGTELERVRRSMEETSGVSAGLQNELYVKTLESEQLAAAIANLQHQVEEVRASQRESEAKATELQRRLEIEASEQEALRRRLRTREQELEDVVTANETSGVELYKLRRELEAAAEANEQLEEALRLQPDVEDGPTLMQEQQWPEEAISEIRRLKGTVAERTRQHAEQLARVEVLSGLADGSADAQRQRYRLLELEVTVRAEEQECVLGLLESAEQKIWEMTDESDRNAARLAAGLAQLEKHKEQIDELRDELEVSQSLLAAAQARALEQERLLASERAKLARAGIGADGLLPSRRSSDPGADVDQLFAELEAGILPTMLVDLDPPPEPSEAEPGAPDTLVTDHTGSFGSPEATRSSTRMVVEALEGDGEWPEPPAALEEVPHGEDQTAPVSIRPGPPVSLVRDGAKDADPKKRSTES